MSTLLKLTLSNLPYCIYLRDRDAHSEVKGFVVGLKWGAGPGVGCFKCETACMETGANNCVVRLELVLGDPGRP